MGSLEAKTSILLAKSIEILFFICSTMKLTNEESVAKNLDLVDEAFPWEPGDYDLGERTISVTIQLLKTQVNMCAYGCKCM